MEDYELLGFQPAEAEVEEARRLVYVGMTRARDRLTLTRVERRFGRDTGGSKFLEEMRLLGRDQLSDKDVGLPVLHFKE